MVLKTYCTHHGALTTFVYVGKKKTNISFEPSHRGNMGYFTTNDEKLQEAIEKDSSFGKKIKLYSRQAEAVENEPIIELTPIEGISNWQEAASYLKDKFSISGLFLRGYQSVIKQAEEHGIYFPDLKEYESE